MKKENGIVRMRKGLCGFVLLGLSIFSIIAAAAGFINLCKREELLFLKPYGLFLSALFLMFILAQVVWLCHYITANGKQIQTFLFRGLLCFGILALQILCLNGLGKIALTEDSFKVIDMASNMVYNTGGILDNTSAESVYAGYFARYSNNHFITIFFYYFFSVLHYFGCNEFVLAARILNVILLDLGIFLTYLSARKMWGNKKADLLLFLMAISPTTYVWLFWSYTNTFSIPFVMGILLLYLYAKDCNNNRKLFLYGIGTGVVGVVGYFIRPTTIIPIIAIVIMSILWFGKKRIRVWFLGLCLVALAGMGSVYTIFNMHLIDQSKAESFPITHWIMLGLSETGGYNKEDVRYTSSFPAKQEKQQANSAEIKRRIKNRHVLGMAKLVAKKLCRVYGDGEDNFTQQRFFSEDQTALFDYMYGEKNGWFLFYCKVFRILVLGCVIIQTIILLRRGDKERDDTFLYAFTLFGSMLFFLIWEANNKYSISFEYVILLLAGNAISTVSEKIAYPFMESKKKRIINLKCGMIALCGIGASLLFFFMGWNHYVVEKRIYQHNFVNLKVERAAQVIDDVAECRKKLEQSFSANTSFDHLKLYISQMDVDCETVYKINILNKDGTILAERKINAQSKCISNKSLNLSFPKIIPEKKKETYVLRIESISGDKDFIGFHFNQYYCEDKYRGGYLTIADCAQKKDLCMQVYDKREEAYFSKQGYIVGGILLCLFECCCLQAGLCIPMKRP